MYAMINTRITEERNYEDGFIYSFFVYWVTVVNEAARVQWHHNHVVTTPAHFGDNNPFELQTLAARVEDALWDGLENEHFENSPHWSAEGWAPLSERMEPFGEEWQLEQREREFEFDGPCF